MLFELKEVSKYFGEDPECSVKAVDHISLNVLESDFIALVGPSGSGKTTFLNILGGLVLPDAGEVSYKGISLHKLNEKERTSYRLKNIGFIFQDYQLLPMLTALENIQLPLQVKGMSESELTKKAQWALEQVGISHLGNRYPGQMSGGQQQRVAIARAIADKPALILADEPTANIDSKTAQDIIDIFRKLNKEFSLTFIFSTHDQRLIGQVDRVLKMRDGKFEATGPV